MFLGDTHCLGGRSLAEVGGFHKNGGGHFGSQRNNAFLTGGTLYEENKKSEVKRMSKGTEERKRERERGGERERQRD